MYRDCKIAELRSFGNRRSYLAHPELMRVCLHNSWKRFCLTTSGSDIIPPSSFPFRRSFPKGFLPSDLNSPARMTRPVTIKIYDRNSIASRAEANGIKVYVIVSTRFPLTLARKALTKKIKSSRNQLQDQVLLLTDLNDLVRGAFDADQTSFIWSFSLSRY